MKRIISFIKRNFLGLLFFVFIVVPAIATMAMFIVLFWKQKVFNIAETEKEMEIMCSLSICNMITAGTALVVMIAKGYNK